MILAIALLFAGIWVLNGTEMNSHNLYCANVPQESIPGKILNSTGRIAVFWGHPNSGKYASQKNRDSFDLLCQRRCLRHRICTSVQTYVRGNRLFCDLYYFNPCQIPLKHYSLSNFSEAFIYCTTEAPCKDPKIWTCTRPKFARRIDDCLELWSHVITLTSADECYQTTYSEGSQNSSEVCVTVDITV